MIEVRLEDASQATLTKGATTLVCRFGDYLTKNKSCGEGRPSLFAAPFSIAAGANFRFCVPSTIFQANLCAACYLTFSRLWCIINTEKEREVHKMKKKMIFWDNDFDRMFDEAVEELEKNQENNENNA